MVNLTEPTMNCWAGVGVCVAGKNEDEKHLSIDLTYRTNGPQCMEVLFRLENVFYIIHVYSSMLFKQLKLSDFCFVSHNGAVHSCESETGIMALHQSS